MTRFKPGFSHRRVAMLTLGLLSLAGCASFTQEMEAFDRQTVTSGAWLGVAIGMDRDAARHALLADPRFTAGMSAALTDGKAYCGGGDAVDNYRAEDNGATLYVEVYSRAGRVTCVAHWKQPLQLTG